MPEVMQTQPTPNLPLLELEHFKLMAVALAIGLLIGLERGWSARDKADGMRIAGLRTYGLLSVLGGLWALLAQQAGQTLMGFAFLAVTLIVLVAYRGSLKKFENLSITGSIASLISFSLGALALYGHVALASATAVVMTALLGFKPLLHGWVNKLEQQELYATLKFLLISVVILPILPDQGYGPGAAFNPYQIWWMVVLIAGISYFGYFLMKTLGDHNGPVLTGLLGGLVSSTAVTLNLARLNKQYAAMQNVLAAGILLACATMFARILIVLSIFSPALMHKLMPSLAIMGSLTLLLAMLLWRNSRALATEHNITLENPFQLGMALKFAALLGAVMLLSRLLKSYFGDMGTYVLAAVSGIADVDAITLSLAQISHGDAEIKVAGYAIMLAVLVNSGFKSILAGLIGGAGLGWRIGGVLMLAIGVGLLVI